MKVEIWQPTNNPLMITTMKKTYKYLALAAVTIGFAACSQEEDFAPQQSDIVQIASAYIATEVQTRVNTDGDGDAFENTDKILLVNNSRTDKNTGTYTYNGEAWSLTDGMVLWASGTTVENNFTAYYPASKTFELPTDQRTLENLKSADRMKATATASKGYNVELAFAHQNAKVTITTVMNSQYDENATISDLKIGEVTPYNPATNSYTAILAPTESGFTVKLKVNGTELTATSSATLEAGKHYTFTLKVGKSAATFGTVSVKEWGRTDPLTGGEATELDCLDETTNTFYVATANGLYAWNEAAQTDLSINLVLMADITLPNTDLTTGAEITVANGVPSGSNWTPVGTSEPYYTGSIDGNNHTITGLRTTTETYYTGFIGCLGNGTNVGELKNLTLEDAVVYSQKYFVGGFAGYNYGGTISGCTFGSTTDNSSVFGAATEYYPYVGGIVAYNSGGIVSSCTNNGTVSASGATAWAGGIVAYSFKGSSVSNCTNNGTVSSTGNGTGTESSSESLYAGGIVGYNGNNSTVSGCTNKSTVSSTGKDSSSGYSYAGGIVGGNTDSTVSGCTNEGEASGTGSSENYVGGIIGMNLRGTLENNTNNGTPADE